MFIKNTSYFKHFVEAVCRRATAFYPFFKDLWPIYRFLLHLIIK